MTAFSPKRTNAMLRECAIADLRRVARELAICGQTGRSNVRSRAAASLNRVLHLVLHWGELLTVGEAVCEVSDRNSFRLETKPFRVDDLVTIRR